MAKYSVLSFGRRIYCAFQSLPPDELGEINVEIQDCRLMKLAEVLRLCGLSKSTLYELIPKGEFPASVRISARSVGWRQYEVREWLESRPKTFETKPAKPVNRRGSKTNQHTSART